MASEVPRPSRAFALTEGAARIVSGLLEARTGQLVSESRAWRMETALKPVLRAHRLEDMEALAGRLARADDRALENDVVNALLNNESSFFRDRAIFEMIDRQILPRIRAGHPNRTLRIWSAGCSTGQEAYSIAMQLRRAAELWRGWRIEIVATDISTVAIERARSGMFSRIDVQRGLAVGDLLRWFEPVGEAWRIREELRGMIDFRTENLFAPRHPGGRYDLILCRNVLLYLTSQRRQAVLRLLARHSHAETVLFLGAGETMIGQSEDFMPHPDFRGAYGPRPAPSRRTD
ncbi:MAG: protein-glutamate O-methyltransferase CheR [Sphingobium sp.]